MLTVVHQSGQAAACNLRHPVDERMARWLLMTQDRVGQSDVPLTHEFLASMLGVQRPTVSVVTRTLQTAGLIRQRRRMITIVDRAGLEESACECYGAIRRKFARLLPKTYSE